ncbi:MAG: glycine reductase complex [Firmicutes bacterium]|nr:glycine reductase complex [Bacillota bacterium]
MLPVLKGVGYALIHTPNILYHNGATQTMERRKHPESEYLKKLKNHLREYTNSLDYLPNQAYIGNCLLDELAIIPRPWYTKTAPIPARFGPYGEIMPEDEFYGLLKISDTFDLVVLEENFLISIKEKLNTHQLISKKQLTSLTTGKKLPDIERMVAAHTAEGLYLGDRVVGCIRQAHEIDENLSAHIILENTVAKASGALAIIHLLHNTRVNAADIDYIIECSEEACGDVNQRGGGNFAKAIGEIADLGNATGSDVRGFCAGPVHALLEAASLIKAGVFKNVVVVGGGSTAKLGMNGKDHVAKNMPALEDMLGTFALLISKNDFINPVIRLDVIGKHNIGSGSAPQQVMKALISEPLTKLGKKIKDIDYYSVEMQNPELTEPAGAGNVPEANYKIIGALAVMNGEMTRSELPAFVAKHGLPGFAPTQGHIPSGVPVLGYIRDQLLAGNINNAMLIGKGSLFLARMTNLFDGLSLIIEKNSGVTELLTETSDLLATSITPKKINIGITLLGSEHGPEEVIRGAEIAQKNLPAVKIVIIGPASAQTQLTKINAEDERTCHQHMTNMLATGELDAAVTMHHNFPIGIATVGLVITPSRGEKMFIASTTGTTATNRVESMVRNTLCGISAAKAYGIASPTVGILNVDGAKKTEGILRELKNEGYDINFAHSKRADGGIIMRGNDLLMGTPDIMVTDSLTGNLLMKVFSAYTTGGNYETSGYGYGPGIGENFSSIINIISRSSGAAVIASAIEYADEMVKGQALAIAAQEFASANQAGLRELLTQPNKQTIPATEITIPPKKIVDQQIVGIDVLELERAQKLLWQHGIYAETGMGCIGPIILVAPDEQNIALQLLKQHKYII